MNLHKDPAILVRQWRLDGEKENRETYKIRVRQDVCCFITGRAVHNTEAILETASERKRLWLDKLRPVSYCSVPIPRTRHIITSASATRHT